MARWRCKYVTYECLTCERTWNGSYWQPLDTMANLEELDSSSANRTAMSNREALTCTCDAPHVRVIFNRNGDGSTVQVRASQRAVVYQFPDGSWAQPGTNDPNDPVAQSSIRDGAVRREFPHVRDLHDFQRSLRKSSTDETSGYNDVVDMDESTRRDRGAETLDMRDLHRREDRLRTAFDHFNGRLGGERYEQLLRRMKR